MFKRRYGENDRITIDTGTESKVQQHFKDETDINRIVKKANQVGHLPEMIKKNPIYGDFAETPTYQDALELVMKAEAQFQALPAVARDRFRNDPRELMNYVHSGQASAEELVKYGLAHLVKMEEPEQQKEQSVEKKD